MPPAFDLRGANIGNLILTGGYLANGRDIVGFVMVDSERGDYRSRLDLERVKELGVEIVDLPLVSESSDPLADPECLSQALLSLV